MEGTHAASAAPVVLVTGSSSGIGAAIARRFAAEGCHVALNSSRSEGSGADLAEELGGVYVKADVADPDETAAMVGEVAQRLGGLDVLVNCAGTTAVIDHDDLQAVTTEVWDRILSVNVLGPWFAVAAAAPHLRAGDGGQVINITSTSAKRPAGSSIPYSVSKAALNHMTAMLAKALGPAIRVNAVAPGMVDTPWTADWHEARDHVSENVPLRRPGRPEDVAEVCWSISRATYMTGAIVPVDGGLSLL